MRLDEILKFVETSPVKSRKRRLVEANGEKLHRDIFLYMAPREPADQFAQCGTCDLFTGYRCAILGDRPITADMSCGSYVHGTPHKQHVREAATAEEVGLVKRSVRCENCISFLDGKCKLYEMLNKKMPDVFALDADVDAKACCNAQSPKLTKAKQ